MQPEIDADIAQLGGEPLEGSGFESETPEETYPSDPTSTEVLQ
jgi:hypothetical protein